MSIKEKKEEKRRKILQSAKELFLKNRIVNVSMKNVAKNASIAEGTVYLYFKNKDELLFEVFKELSKNQTSIALSNINESHSLKEKILLLFSYYINDEEKEFINLYSDFYITCMNSYNTKQHQFISNDYEELFTIIEIFLNESIEKKEIKSTNTKNLAESICATIDGLFFYSVIIDNFNFKTKLNNYLDTQIDLLELT